MSKQHLLILSSKSSLLSLPAIFNKHEAQAKYKMAGKLISMDWELAEETSSARFHLEGIFFQKEIVAFGCLWKEIAFGRKLGGNIVIRMEMRREFYFISSFLRIKQFSYNFVQNKTLKMPFQTI